MVKKQKERKENEEVNRAKKEGTYSPQTPSQAEGSRETVEESLHEKGGEGGRSPEAS